MANPKSDQITIQADEETARAYRAASEEDRQKIDALLGFKLPNLTRSQISLRDYMDETSSRAEVRGLTPEKLEDLLNDE